MTRIQCRQIERESRVNPSGRLGTPRMVALLVLFSAFAPLAHASGPEIRRVYAPANQISKWFPPGTELRVMPADEFESLVKRANAGSSRQTTPEAPRLIRARHQARWSAGFLTGQTELIIGSDPGGPVDFVLDAWSPAVRRATGSVAALPPAGELPVNPFAGPARTDSHALPVVRNPAVNWVLGAHDSGKTSIWVDRHPAQAVRLDWLLEPQRKARGKRFYLALPGEATTILSLEVPKDWIPSIRQGRRRGPLEARSAVENLWEVEAESGRIELQLYDPDEGVELPTGSDLWVSGATQIDLRGPPERSGGLINWSTDWVLELDPRNPTPLEVELDPGLELINVLGSGVRGYRIVPWRGAERGVGDLGGEL